MSACIPKDETYSNAAIALQYGPSTFYVSTHSTVHLISQEKKCIFGFPVQKRKLILYARVYFM